MPRLHNFSFLSCFCVIIKSTFVLLVCFFVYNHIQTKMSTVAYDPSEGKTESKDEISYDELGITPDDDEEENVDERADEESYDIPQKGKGNINGGGSSSGGGGSGSQTIYSDNDEAELLGLTTPLWPHDNNHDQGMAKEHKEKKWGDYKPTKDYIGGHDPRPVSPPVLGYNQTVIGHDGDSDLVYAAAVKRPRTTPPVVVVPRVIYVEGTSNSGGGGGGGGRGSGTSGYVQLDFPRNSDIANFQRFAHAFMGLTGLQDFHRVWNYDIHDMPSASRILRDMINPATGQFDQRYSMEIMSELIKISEIPVAVMTQSRALNRKHAYYSTDLSRFTEIQHALDNRTYIAFAQYCAISFADTNVIFKGAWPRKQVGQIKRDLRIMSSQAYQDIEVGGRL